ncbi:MAG: DUF302 domain-containing protein [Pseudoxanthomonas suwonensis]|nr:DUF302 domain-containing protein [Pseudoxanthomonas suwonensis]
MRGLVVLALSGVIGLSACGPAAEPATGATSVATDAATDAANAAAMVASVPAGNAPLNTLDSRADVARTTEALVAAFTDKGITVFSVIDHAAAASEAGLAMPPTRVIIHGNPAAGTPLMQAHPDLALDLPLRVLVREEPDAATRVLWRGPAAMERMQGLPNGMLGRLAPVDALIRNTVAGLGADP